MTGSHQVLPDEPRSSTARSSNDAALNAMFSTHASSPTTTLRDSAKATAAARATKDLWGPERELQSSHRSSNNRHNNERSTPFPLTSHRSYQERSHHERSGRERSMPAPLNKHRSYNERSIGGNRERSVGGNRNHHTFSHSERLVEKLVPRPWWWKIAPKKFRGKQAGIKILHEEAEEEPEIVRHSNTNSSRVGSSSSERERDSKWSGSGARGGMSRSFAIQEMKDKFEHFVKRAVIHPESPYRMGWDMVTAGLVVVLMWLIPFSLGFDEWETPEGFDSLSLFMDVWFLTDILINFRTGYVDHGATILQPKKIATNYLKSWFLIDAFASIPWERFVDDATTSKQNKNTRKSLKITKYFKIPKLLRIARLLRAFNKYARFYALTLVVLGMATTLHCAACMIAWTLDICSAPFLIDRNGDGALTWESNYSGRSVCENDAVFSLYSESLFVAFTIIVGMTPSGGTFGGSSKLISKGGVTITQAMKAWNFENSSIYILTSSIMIIGVAELALLVGHIGLLLRDRFLASAAYRSKLDRVKEELKYYKVPWGLQNRVLAYYDYLWVNQKQYDDKIMLLTDQGMSTDLRGKLALHMYKDVVQGVSLFSQIDDMFLSKVCMELQTRVFLPDDWIILKGDIGSELYIISRGVCQVYVIDPWEMDEIEAEQEQEIFLSNGQFFGEISLLMEVRRTTSVQARTICEVNVLVQEIFEEILRESPDFAAEMKTLIVDRKVQNFQTANKSNATEEDVEMISMAVSEAIESRQLTIGGANEGFGLTSTGTSFDGNDHDDDELHSMAAAAAAENERLQENEMRSTNQLAITDSSSSAFHEEIEANKLISPLADRIGIGSASRGSHQQGSSVTLSQSSDGIIFGNMGGHQFDPQMRDKLKKTLSAVSEDLTLHSGSAEVMSSPDTRRANERRAREAATLSSILDAGNVVRVSNGDQNNKDEERDEREPTMINLNDEESKMNALEEDDADEESDDIREENTDLFQSDISDKSNIIVKQNSSTPQVRRQGTRAEFLSSLNSPANNAVAEGFEKDETLSQQLGLLQERIDKIYAMLTTKLGRVR
jgi:hyperpolarization activated cyclic nucleotide-gated potassium channel 2